ncbi:MAG: hypothetical protein QNJ89_09985 [Acidimicrobiia bacterium]|nr:hypothetical protein [Acidimicrobiia bacterium]
MASLGWYLIIFGAGSGLMSLFDYEFSLLMWIDTWGDGFAWLIRGAFILGGMSLISREQKLQQDQQAQAAQNVPQGPVS